MKWVFTVLLIPLGALAQLPIPLTPDWLRSDKESGVLHSTQVQLVGNNFRVLQTNVVAKSGGFKLLGFITIKSPSYVKAVSRLYAKAHVEEGQPQAFANLVYESGGMNLILFSLPKIRVRGDLVEFIGTPESGAGEPAVARRPRREEPPATRTREVEQPGRPVTRETDDPDAARTRTSLRERLRNPSE